MVGEIFDVRQLARDCAAAYDGRRVARSTDTIGSESPRASGRAPAWALVLALDCGDLRARPIRLTLAPVDEVIIGRGSARAFCRDGRQLRIELSDASASQQHARLSRAGDGWAIEDAGSKNGTRVNGHRIERATLADGDLIECGGTFFVLRRAAGPVDEREPPPDAVDALQTLSPALEHELDVLRKIARSKVPVVVRGDSGTGKEVMARAIHHLSRRAGPFVAVNCGAIPPTLIESELFGSRRGAFSGAEDRNGLVRNAERGTLFLDEIAELPVTSQTALLRVLQEGEVLPLGAGKPLVVDVRVVAATNRPIEELIADGRFRRDLYARLRGFELRLPPLRARIEDLGLLCANLLARLEPQRPPRRLSRTAARALFLHPWPFHVRELEQALRAALAVCEGDEIGVEHLHLQAPVAEAEAGVGERERLVALLHKHAGNVSAVARELETSRSQVDRLLARHALDAADYKRL
jgi:transcriptional regulator of acetoin/glycerol metabolism